MEVLRRSLAEMNVTTGSVIDLFDGAPVGADYVESLHETIKYLAALDGVHGGADVAPLALRSFHRAQLILREGRYQPASERDLEAVTAEIAELSGWLLFDAERHQESRRVNAEALTLARIAGDTSMEWFVLSNQALASVHTGRNREALRIAQGMTRSQDLPRRVQALFDVRAARALAALGDSTSALRAFDRARSAFADGTTTRDPAWSWWFDERELAGHEGMIHSALGDHSRAVPHLATAVERSQGREHFRWALYIHRANLLRALLRASSWAEAERVAIDLVPMVGMIASARTEGLLRRTVARPEARPQMLSTLSDILDYIGNRLADSNRFRPRDLPAQSVE
jgi:tetratricopeptide (TPR) repeat protein